MASDEEHSFGWASAEDDETYEDNLNQDEDVKEEIVKKPVNGKKIKSEPMSEYSTDESEADVKPNISNNSFSNNSSKILNRSIDSQKLKDFLKNNPKLINVPSSNIEEISEDDDVWLMQCPYTFDIQSLVGLALLENEKNKTKIPGTKYECVLFEKNKNQPVNILMPSTKTNSATITSHFIKGKFIVREKIKNVPNVELNEEQTEKVPFPPNLKTRHPLFGVDYKKQIKISKEIKEQFLEPPIKIKSKIKNDNNSNCEDISMAKSDRKRKASEMLDNSLDISAKKIKKEKSNIWETELSIEQNLFDIPKKKKSKKSLI